MPGHDEVSPASVGERPEARVAIYVRVSTQEQSCELQREELSRFTAARGWEVVGVYEDKATGTDGKRPMLQALLSDARARKFDILLCWKLDRVFRSLKGLVTTLQELSELGIEFVSLKDQIDMTTASGRLMTHILAAFAEFEASLIRERVKAGLENAKRKGTKLGRPKTRDDGAILTLRSEGLSHREIARRLGLSKGSVQKALAGGHKTPSSDLPTSS